MKGSRAALGLLGVSLLAASGARAGDEMPADPKAFVEAVKAGRLPPVADWPRYKGKVEAPPFGAVPPADAENPVPGGKDAWNTPADGGTLIIQDNAAPKSLNSVIDNDAVITNICEVFVAYLAVADKVTFSYGRPSAEDPGHAFIGGPKDIAARWIKEDSLVRKDGTRLFGAVTEKDGNWVVTPLAKVEGEARAAATVPKQEGDRVLPGTFVTAWLRPGVKWHDGAPFTARDVEFSLKVVKNENVNSDNVKPYFGLVESCTALSDSAVRWVLDRPYFHADDVTIGETLTLLPLHAYRAAFEKSVAAAGGKGPPPAFDPSGPDFGRFFNTYTPLNEKPLGTGPYKVESFEVNRSVVLVRNPDYFGPKPHADRILWKFIADAVAAVQALKGGEIDFASTGPTAEQYATVMQDPAFRAKFVPCRWFTPACSFIAYNRRERRLSDPRVRAALGLLLDRPGFREAKHHGCSVLISGDQFVSGPACDPEVKPLAYDPDAAEELLDEAGWRDRNGDGLRDRDGEKLEFEFLITSENKAVEELAALWIEALKKAGIGIRIAKMEWAAFVKRFEDKKFDVITLGWASDPESDPEQLWHSRWADPSKPSSNAASFVDPRADALIEAIKVTLDPKERCRYQRALHRILDADQPYTFLWCRADIGAYDRRWRGVRFYPKRPGWDLTEWYLPKEQQK